MFRLSKPSGPMMMSTAALVVALGGTSYAAATIGSKDIQNGAVTSPKIKDGTIKKIDLAPGTAVSGPQGPQGPVGPAGVDGTNGVDGTDGADGADGADGVGRWALVNGAGQIVSQSGGFEVVAAYPTLANTSTPPAADNSLRAAGNVYLDANEDLSNNGIVATIQLQNTVDQNNNANTNGRASGADVNPEFSGEITVSRCNFTPAPTPAIPTNCAPSGAQNTTSFVVSPRMSDGSVTVPGDGTPANPSTRKWFYVVITGDSSDYVAPTTP